VVGANMLLAFYDGTAAVITFPLVAHCSPFPSIRTDTHGLASDS
jgi:hypothetical protein